MKTKEEKPTKKGEKPATGFATGLDTVKMVHPNGTPVTVTRMTVPQFEKKGYKVAD